MALPPVLRDRLRLPVIGSPLFIISGPDLVIAQCKAGIVGSFPALNARPISQLDEWLAQITEELAAHDRAHPEAPSAPFAVNQIVHKTNNRLEEDVELCAKYRVPVIITSLGAREDVNAAVHGWGGIILHDVINQSFAHKAVEKGADGLIPVAAGAGGHAGNQHPFALLNEIRQFFTGTIILSGALSTGGDVAAALMAGADLGYMGTRFIATQEAAAGDDYKSMLSETTAKDITYTDAISGINANFLTPSLVANGLDPNAAKDPTHKIDMAHELNPDAKAWKTVWSAGQGVGSIHDAPPVAELVARLKTEFTAAADAFAAKRGAFGL